MPVTTTLRERYVPYQETRPRTSDVRALRAELHRVRDVYSRGSSQANEAFNALCVAAAAAGHPLSALRRHSRVESERFFARTIPGPDGHVYWDGGKTFARNDGTVTVPRRWWWSHIHGRLDPLDGVVMPTCGDRACINPDHCAKESRGVNRRHHSDLALVGMVQVVAMRLGRVPTTREWDTLNLGVTYQAVSLRFGTWVTFLRSAGLTPPPRITHVTLADCVATVRAARAILGRWPMSYADLHTVKPQLKAAGHVVRDQTLYKHLGHWPAAIHKAKHHRA